MKKIPILLVLIALGTSDLTGIAMAADGEGVKNDHASSLVEDEVTIEVNKVLEPALVFVGTSVAGNRLQYKFTGAEKNLGLWQLYVADYDTQHYSQRMVEENLELLGSEEKPEWAREMANLSIKWKNGDLGLQAPSLGVGNQLVGNVAGVLYYAAQIRDNSEGVDNPTYYWVRGKLDYRECAYSSRNLPHIAHSCQVRVDTEAGRYVFEQQAGVVRDENDLYVPWAKELTQRSKDALNYLQTRIKRWEGDATEKAEITRDLQGVKDTAEDTTEEAQILAKVAECEELWLKKIAIYEPEEPKPEVGEGGGAGGDGSDDGEEQGGSGDGSGGDGDGDQSGGGEESGGALGTGGAGDVSADSDGKDDIGVGMGSSGQGTGTTAAEKPKPSTPEGAQSDVSENEAGSEVAIQKPAEVAANVNLGRTADSGKNAAAGISEASNNEKAPDEAMKKVDLEQNKGKAIGVEVPKLSENKSKWGISAAIGGGFMAAAALLGSIWWLKRRK